MAAAPQWAEVARGVLAIAQAIAIVIGAAWAYFKFVRGRTFAERLEVSLEGTPFRVGESVALRIHVGMTNTGAAIVRLAEEFTVVYVFGVTVDRATSGEHIDWGKHLDVVPVFTRHEWIEAQETVADEVLVTLSHGEWLAYRIELIVASKKDKRWGTTAIAPAADTG
jgi:hypothetical protein